MDNETIKDIFLQHKDKLYFYALRIMQNSDIAMDVVQDVFEKLLSSKDSLDLDKVVNLKAYCITCVIRSCQERKRKKNVEIEFSSISDYLCGIDFDEPEYTYKELNVLIDKLNEKQKRVIQLRFEENYSIAEIADQLNMKEDSVYTLLSRSYKILREKLAPSI